MPKKREDDEEDGQPSRKPPTPARAQAASESNAMYNFTRTEYGKEYRPEHSLHAIVSKLGDMMGRPKGK